MRKIFTALAFAAGLSLVGSAATANNAATVQPNAAADTAVQQLLQRVEIPYETFTLDNGLRVVVHEDRKAPVVAVSIWYNVGSKDEPAGRTGFAHLFEHLMFNGSENAPGEYFEYTRQMGATDLNGTTWFDRTNYFQTVPRPALERALFLESDRMGHLLGAVTQENLTNQIGVVQNEKRQGDNQPYGMVEYAQLEGLFPEGHPYRHSTIGSMADLSAATLDTVREWFRDNYGPNNAVLVLAGDINAAEARPLVERYFGPIPRGPVNIPAQADVPTLESRVDQHSAVRSVVADHACQNSNRDVLDGAGAELSLDQPVTEPVLDRDRVLVARLVDRQLPDREAFEEERDESRRTVVAYDAGAGDDWSRAWTLTWPETPTCRSVPCSVVRGCSVHTDESRSRCW